MRFLFYSHDGLGLGHVRRHLAIASALNDLAPKAKVLLTTSVDEVSHLGLPPNVDTLKLPGLRKIGNNQYVCRRLGLRTQEIRSMRSALLQAAVASFHPALVLVDKHPFGAAGEFRAALETAKLDSARAVLGLRDILDEPATVMREWSIDGIREGIGYYFDRILIYGSASLFDVAEEYHLPPAVSPRARYCGYVVNRPACGWPAGPCPYCCAPDDDPLPLVIGTAGGGEDGAIVLKAFIRAVAGAPWKAMAISGPQLPAEELKSLQRLAAEAQVELQTFVPCLLKLYRKAAAVVCMGGYNTLVETISSGVPTVCVPRVSPRTEQLLRARIFERLGLLRLVHPDQLTPERLRHEIGLALKTPRERILERAGAALQFDGARKAASQLLDLVLRPRGAATGQLVYAVS